MPQAQNSTEWGLISDFIGRGLPIFSFVGKGAVFYICWGQVQEAGVGTQQWGGVGVLGDLENRCILGQL